MTKIYPDLYQLTYVMERADISVHQYLLMTEEPILVQIGAIPEAKEILSEVKELLGEQPLKYLLISHFEADECGGVTLAIKEYPDLTCVCSRTTAEQLLGFDLAKNIKIMEHGEKLVGNDFELQAIEYPSEMHMQQGLVFTENKRNIFFSADLMFAFGKNHGQVIQSSWADAVENSGAKRLPSVEMQKKVTEHLKAICPAFVASGHGPCMKIIA